MSNQHFATTTRVTFKGKKASPPSGTVVQAITYYKDKWANVTKKHYQDWYVIVEEDQIYVQRITLDPSSVEMNVGNTQLIRPTIQPENATNQDVIWSSNNSTVASVSNTGWVQANSIGTAIITCYATDGSGVYSQCSVKVSPLIIYVTRVSLNATSATLNVGDTKQLYASVSPSSATDKSVSWSSSNSSVASVSSNGLVTANSSGSATITCKANDGSGKYATCSITVKSAAVTPTFSVMTNAATSVTGTSAVLNGYVSSSNTINSYTAGFFLSTSGTPSSNNYTKKVTYSGSSPTGNYSASATGLTNGTKYYCRAYVLYDGTYYYGTTKDFTTEASATFSITTYIATDVTETSAVLNGNISASNTTNSYTAGFFISTSGLPSSDNYLKNVTYSGYSPTGEYSVSVEGLANETEYYCRAYVLYDGIYYYGMNTIDFTTTKPVPTVTANGVTSITETSAILNGFVSAPNILKDYIVGFFVCTAGTPTEHNYTKKLTYGDYSPTGSYSIAVTGLSSGITYCYRAYVLYEGQYYYGSYDYFTTNGVVSGLDCPDFDHPHLRDLGLPSGIKWACCNVGANQPAEYGGYYSWGETSAKNVYNWSTYKWCNGSWNSLTKYCSSSFYGMVDNKTTLEIADDVAHVKWGNRWRMPTREEMEELISSCTLEKVTYNGVNGWKLTGLNGVAIFLPAAGLRFDLDSKDVGFYPYYWSSTASNSEASWYLYYNSSYGLRIDDGYVRSCGLPIRPVNTDESNGIGFIKEELPTNSLRYNLTGQKVSKDYKGIIILNGREYLSK